METAIVGTHERTAGVRADGGLPEGHRLPRGCEAPQVPRIGSVVDVQLLLEGEALSRIAALVYAQVIQMPGCTDIGGGFGRLSGPVRFCVNYICCSACRSRRHRFGKVGVEVKAPRALLLLRVGPVQLSLVLQLLEKRTWAGKLAGDNRIRQGEQRAAARFKGRDALPHRRFAFSHRQHPRQSGQRPLLSAIFDHTGA